LNYTAIFSRILQAVDHEAYLTPHDTVDVAQRDALAEVAAFLRADDFDVAIARERVRAMHAAGRLDEVHMLSALHVISASPRVKDYREAARLAGEQEHAALALGGPHLERHLASVDRHRGVLAFLQGHYAVALDHFTRSLERQRTAENLGNVLSALLRLGELEEAESLVRQATRALGPEVASQLQQRIHADPDLAVLRDVPHD
jgi:tetratricopeptide (TPR) repeat protein